jgi:hypothetical protein
MKGPEEDEEKVQQYLQTACIGWMNKTKNLEKVQQDPNSPKGNKHEKTHQSPGRHVQELAIEITQKQN